MTRQKETYVFTDTIHGLTDFPIAPGQKVALDPASVKDLIDRGVCKVSPKEKVRSASGRDPRTPTSGQGDAATEQPLTDPATS